MPTYASVTVGDALPTLNKAPSRLQLVQYAAGSGDFNPLHFDPDFPQAKQIGDNIVHGRMKYACLGELVSEWLGHSGWVKSISCQYRGMDMRGAAFTVTGTVAGKREENGQKIVELDVWTANEAGQKTTPGKAVVVLSG